MISVKQQSVLYYIINIIRHITDTQGAASQFALPAKYYWGDKIRNKRAGQLASMNE